MVTEKDLSTPNKIQWCPGCGDFGILTALKNALVKIKADPANTVIVSGIGCSGKVPHYIKTYGYEAIHGRPLPVAMGIKFANHKLNVIAVAGDGDGYGIGMGHFIHTMRRNMDLTYIVHNNQIYGLTKGQYSPTTDKGTKTKSSPFGAVEVPVKPLALAISSGATFVARGFAGDVKKLSKLIAEGIKHKGFSLIDVMQPCISFHNSEQYIKEKGYDLDATKHDPSDIKAAFMKAEEWGKKFPLGVVYKVKQPTYEDSLPQLKAKPVCKHSISNVDINPVLDEYV